jgi:hypothetical protein
MRYLASVIHDGTDLATPAEVAAIDTFNDRLISPASGSSKRPISTSP